VDPTNPVVVLCAQGMQAEAEGRPDAARELFEQAWAAASDDFEACVAAHYLARQQSTPADALHWNQVCLDRADRVGDERVRGFYPSLHLNLAKAERELGRPELAAEHFRRAAEHIDDAPPGPYADGIRFAIAAGLREATDGPLADLVGRLCARADLTALALILPPYLGDLGTHDDRTRLLTALHMVHLGRSLPDDEQALLGQAIADYSEASS
jgi:tetratricopeptide (TPR) repeat protein